VDINGDAKLSVILLDYDRCGLTISEDLNSRILYIFRVPHFSILKR